MEVPGFRSIVAGTGAVAGTVACGTGAAVAAAAACACSQQLLSEQTLQTDVPFCCCWM